MTRHADNVVLITGATGGIGAAVARRLAREGASLVLLDADERPLAALALELDTRAATFAGDIADKETMRGAVRLADDTFGRIDAAFLNAGIEGPVAPIESVDLADFDQVMSVNVRAVFIGLAQILPGMKARRRGSVVITSSTAGLRAAAGLSPYVTSKHALIGLMRSAAFEGAAQGVRVNTIHPGPVETRMIQALAEKVRPGDPNAGKAAFIGGIPAGRYGTPEEIAGLVAYLLSDEAGFCTGGTYQADGGIMAGVRPASS